MVRGYARYQRFRKFFNLCKNWSLCHKVNRFKFGLFWSQFWGSCRVRDRHPVIPDPKPWKWEILKSTIFESKPHYFKTARQIFLLLIKINISIEFFRLRYIPGCPTKKVVPKIHGADLKNPPKSQKYPTNHGGARDRHPRGRPGRRGPDPNFEAPHILKSSSIFKKFFSDRTKNL